MSAKHTRDLLELAGHDPHTPVRRTPADGEAEEMVDLAYAVERLEACYTLSAQEIADVLATGATLRTPFAFYREPFQPRMMPGQEPYTPEEQARASALVTDAAMGDPGEAAEPPLVRMQREERSGLTGYHAVHLSGRDICNPAYRHTRADGVACHLEYDPQRGTVLVPDSACKDRTVRP